MSDRVRAEVRIDPEAWGEQHSRLVFADDLEDLQDALERYGPEPVGFVIEVDEAGLEELPDVWRVEDIERHHRSGVFLSREFTLVPTDQEGGDAE